MRILPVLLAGVVSIALGQSPTQEPPVKKAEDVKEASAGPPSTQAQPASEDPRVERREVIVPSGTRIPLSVVNFVSSRNAKAGDPVYLETMFPITIGNRVIIPVGSYVRGTITEVKRSGRVKGRAEMYLRFDSLTLPNGTTREFTATVSQADARIPGNLKEGKIEAEGTKGRDAGTIAATGAAGTSIGAIAGGASGHPGMGTAIGAGAGAVAGLIVALVQRGNEVDLYRGTEVDMTLDRNLVFDEGELTHFGRDPSSDRYYERPGPPPRQGGADPRDRRRFPYPF
ncbi:MAG: hypothetical protein LAO21_05415 [Acidobacteriia bacterium]|nr:hypothetical protein [Terriglobia bacterium]